MSKEKNLKLVPMIAEEDSHVTPWGRIWTHGADVLATFRRHGFVPPSETRSDYCFKINRDAAGK